MSEETENKPERKPKKRPSSEAIARILEEARVEALGPVSDSGQAKLLAEWDKSGKVIASAKQMLEDAIKRQNDAVVAIVKRLGPGPFRYQGKLYSVSSNGDKVYLRELVSREKT